VYLITRQSLEVLEAQSLISVSISGLDSETKTKTLGTIYLTLNVFVSDKFMLYHFYTLSISKLWV